MFPMGAVTTALILFLCALHTQCNSVHDTSLVIPQEGVIQKIESVFQKAANHCVCANYSCGCCSHIIEKKINLNSTVCANATYLKKDYGFSLTVTFNKYTVFNETMSLRNPPPICVGAPYVEDLADVCVRVYDIQTSAAHLHACVEVEAELKHIRLAKYELGCFDMKGSELKTAIQQLENEIL